MNHGAAATAVDPVLAERLRLVVARLARQIRRQTADHVLTLTSRSALVTVEQEGPLSPSELAAIEGVSAPAVSRIAERLASAGYVERQPDPRDGRGYLLSVTAAGHAVLEQRRRRGSTFLEEGLGELSPEQLELVPAAIAVLEALLNRSSSAGRPS